MVTNGSADPHHMSLPRQRPSPIESSSWFKSYKPDPEAHVRLICFPHGGGGPHIYKPWTDLVDPKVEVIAVSLPGRGLRQGEEAIRDMRTLSKTIATEMEPLLDRPYALLGHSVGALLAYEVASELHSRQKLTGCLQLFASAHTAPQYSNAAENGEQIMHDLPDEELVKVIADLGLIPEELLKTPELLAMFLDPIRADFALSETYECQALTKLGVGIVAMGGERDSILPTEKLLHWESCTDEEFQRRTFPGSHFYTRECQTEVLDFINQTIREKLLTCPTSIIFGLTESYPKDKCLHQLFSEQAQLHPSSPAVVFKEEVMSYNQLDKLTDLLAKFLVAKGAGVGKAVAIYMEHCTEYVIAYIGILKAGSAYVPIEIAYPEAMVTKTVKSIEPVVILTKNSFGSIMKHAASQFEGSILEMNCGWDETIQKYSAETLSYENHSPQMPAYYVMTSGTTGEPKGIVCPHQGAINSYYWRYNHYPYTEGEREASNVFFVWEVMRPLLQGASAYVIPDEVIYDPTSLKRFLVDNRISRVLFTPSLLEQMLNSSDIYSGDHMPRLRIVYLNGEVVTAELAKRFIERFPRVQLLNDYSISECHDVCTHNLSQVSFGSVEQYAPLGPPMSNVSVYVLDESLRPVPRGCKGEVFVGGDSIAIGYLNQPEKTGQRFLPDSVTGERVMFRTGDGGRIKLNGDLEVMGRLQFMIKLRGYTIVPDAVATVIKEYPGVEGSVVIPDINEATGQPERLVAYLVLSGSINRGILPSLREYLKQNLPSYSIPSVFEVIPKLPISEVTGKLDLKLLPKRTIQSAAPALLHSVDALELKILSVWQEFMGEAASDPDQDFFDLGGHSLMAIQVAERLKEQHSISLSIVEIFENGTARSLANLIRSKTQAETCSKASVQKVKEEPSTTKSKSIAIIGASCKFPGADNLESFWDLLASGGCSIRSFSKRELERNGVDESTYKGSSYVNAGAVIDDPFEFDYEFWGITKKEATIMDPQQRMFLQVAWEALESSGYAKLKSKIKTGIFAGSYLPSYLLNYLDSRSLSTSADPADFHLAEIGNDKDYLTTRASFLLNCSGPSLAIQTSCSTGLVAVATACQFLQAGQCDHAIAGASSITFPQGGYQYQEGHVLSPDGKCRAFDAKANGTVLGDGVGVMVLKRLDDAIRDGDDIRAIIRGFAINNDGRAKSGYSSPSTKGQTEVVLDALKMAEVEPEDVSYIEGHGTGTIIGDAIEFEALRKAFGPLSQQNSAKTQFCGLGSVKPNIGHSNIAAGMAGLSKLIMAFKNKELPPTINFQKPNPGFDIEQSPFRIQDSLSKWVAPKGRKRLAGISSFGIGGTNCHMILEEPPTVPNESSSNKAKRKEVLTFSAKSEKSLVGVLEKMRIFLRQEMIKPEPVSLSDAAFTLRHGREAFKNYRVAIGADTLSTAINKIDDETRRPHPDQSRAQKGSIVFMFPGQGSQYAKMGLQLYETVDCYKHYFDTCSELFAQKQDLNLQEVLFSDKLSESTSVCQPFLFSLEFSLASTLIDWGIIPSAVIGHSIGEYVAAVIAGILRLEDAVSLVATRSKAMEAAPAGRMLAVNCERPVLEAFLLHKTDLWLAAENSHNNYVISGPEKPIRQAEAILRHRDFQAKRVHVNHAFHCPLMNNAAKKLQAVADEIVMNRPKVPMVSNVTGTWISQEEPFDKTYWAQQMTGKVRFLDTVTAVTDRHPSLMLEVGPSRILKTLSQKIIPRAKPDQKPTYLSTLPHPQEDTKSCDMLMDTLATLWESGIELNWEEIDRQSVGKRVELPTYQFNNKICFPRSLDKIKAPLQKNEQEKLDISDRFYVPGWSQSVSSPKQSTNKHGNWFIATDRNESSSHVLQAEIDLFLRSEGNETVSCCNLENIGEKLSKRNCGKNVSVILLAGFGGEDWNDPAHEASQNFENLLKLFRDLPDDISGRLWIITEGLAQIAEETIKLSNSILCSGGMVLSQEVPSWKVSVIDMLNSAVGSLNDDKLLSLLKTELTHEPPKSSFSVVAFRNRKRWVPNYMSVAIPPEVKETAANQIKEHGVYIITGGRGRIGKSLTTFLCSKNCSVIVTSRNSNGRTIDNQDGDRHGVTLTQVDFGNRQDVERLINMTLTKFGKLDGIFHAAGCADLKYLEELTPGTVQNEFEPKVFGIEYLKQSLESVSPSMAPDFVVLFSSMAAILGGYGMAAYAAANSYMDAFCQRECDRSETRWMSVNWDDWDFEYSKEQTEGYTHSMERKLAMTPEEGIEALERVLALPNDMHQILVVTSKLNDRIKRWHYIDSPQYDLRATEYDDRDIRSDVKNTPGANIRDQTEGVKNRPSKAQQEISAVYMEVLGLDSVQPEDNFFDLGGDSLMAAQVLLHIQRNLDLPIKAHLRDIFQHPTPGSLAEHLSRTHSPA